jgi:hypothetical protein
MTFDKQAKAAYMRNYHKIRNAAIKAGTWSTDTSHSTPASSNQQTAKYTLDASEFEIPTWALLVAVAGSIVGFLLVPVLINHYATRYDSNQDSEE